MAQTALDWAFGTHQDGPVVPSPLAALEPAWQRAHTELISLAKRRAGLDDEEGRWLLSALREGTHVRLGFGSFDEYAERMFGYGRRVTQEKAGGWTRYTPMAVTTPSRRIESSPAPERRYLRAPAPVFFPEAESVPESKRHLRQRTTLYQLLELAFRERAAIGCDQFVYWDPTDPRQCLAPDAFVRWGQPDDDFRSWKVWERGAPDVAVEILSLNDERDRDWNAKLEKYRRLGVRELVCFDSERDVPLLRVWEAVEGDLVERALEAPLARSLVLPATWVVVEDAVAGALLRLSRDADGKELLPTPAELEYERRVAAEARVRELEAELRRRERP